MRAIFKLIIVVHHLRDKKRLHKKEQFPNEAALDRFFVTQVMDYNDKFENRSHRGFKTCRDTLDAMFH